MNGKFNMLIALLSMVVIVCSACGEANTNQVIDSDVNSSSEQSSIAIDESVEKTTVDNNTENLNISDMERYELFLKNEEKVVIHKNSDLGKYISYSQNLNDGEEYNLYEVVDALLTNIIDNGYTPSWLDSIKYAYIDCGNDGEPELAIRISMPAEDPEWWNECLIIKAIDGKLHCCYAGEYWCRSYLKINKYGYISWFEYVGEKQNPSADLQYKNGVVDASGTWHFLYSVDVLTDYALEQHSGISDFGSDQAELLLFALAFNDYSEKGSVYTYALTQDRGDGNKDINFYPIPVRYYDTYYSDNTILGIPVKTGIQIQNIDSVQKMVSEKNEECGLTDEMKEADLVQWDYLELPESMSNLQPFDDNFLGIHHVFPLEMNFASGAGAWSTNLLIEKDGSFTGTYHDTDMGGPEGCDATEYICEFSGKFGNVETVNNYTLSMELLELNVKEYPEKEWIENVEGAKMYRIASAPYGLDDNGKTYHVYLPHAKITDMNENFLAWYYVYPERDCIGEIGMYDVDGEYHYGFSEWKSY